MHISPLLHRLSFATILMFALGSSAADKTVTLTVSAGEVDRAPAIVTFDLPKTAAKFRRLLNSDGVLVPLQVDAEGHAVFIEPNLKKGATKRYQLESAQVPASAVSVKKSGTTLKISVAGKMVTQYQMEPSEVPSTEVKDYFRHGAYLHPVASPSGKIITGDYPSDHRWHRGIWLGWTDTEFEGRHPDFWNMGKEKDGKFTGSVEFGSLQSTWEGLVHGGFTAKHKFIDWTSGAAKPVLNETWSVTVYNTSSGANPMWIFDLVSTQECASDVPLNLPKYHYGGLGVRGNAQWDPVKNVSMLTANGDDRLKGDGSKANWVHMGGELDGTSTGMAILCHPSNFRSPQPLRLNPKNPQLCIAPSADGDWQITPGKPYVSRYRFVVADGNPDAAMLEALWKDYAQPAKVTVSMK